MFPVDSPVIGANADAAPAAAPVSAPRTYHFRFTGNEKEYFRIWVVNLLLSLATFGVYSAWAKVRRLEYFDRNTMLAGARFDFHGQPKTILRGRILAVVLLAVYQYAFGFSLVFGLATVTVLLLALPFMMRGALRFRLGNTSWRGVRFRFSGSIPPAYRTYLAPIAMFLLPGVVVAIAGETPWSALPLLLYLGWPAMHAAMKRYQYGHIAYGDQHATTELWTGDFFKVYLRGFLLACSLIVILIILGILGAALSKILPEATMGMIVGFAAVAVTTVVYYLLLGPYQQVKVLNLCLPQTRFPGVRFVSTLTARGYVRLQFKNLVLTVLSLGLYRPFAVVKAYRYRLAHLAVEADDGFDHILARAGAGGGAAGDGSADFLGIDLSW